LIHRADDLVSRDDRELGERQVPFDDVEVASADATGFNPQADFAWARSWGRQIDCFERPLLNRLRFLELHRFHDGLLTTPLISAFSPAGRR
jgi:hypothetical protein